MAAFDCNLGNGGALPGPVFLRKLCTKEDAKLILFCCVKCACFLCVCECRIMLDSCEVKPTSLIQEQETYFDRSVLLVHNVCVCAKSGQSFPFARHVLAWNVRRLALLPGSFYESSCVETVDGLVLQKLLYKSLFILSGVHTLYKI